MQATYDLQLSVKIKLKQGDVETVHYYWLLWSPHNPQF